MKTDTKDPHKRILLQKSADRALNPPIFESRIFPYSDEISLTPGAVNGASYMKTRDELKAKGILLEGDIVPDWFKRRSDRCSVPTRFAKWALRAEVYSAGCYVHDWDYYKANVAFEPDSPEWKAMIRLANRRLKRNVKLIQRWPLRSWLHGRLYYAGVRIGGQFAARKKSKPEDIWRPPTLKDSGYLLDSLESQKIYTSRAHTILDSWLY